MLIVYNNDFGGYGVPKEVEITNWEEEGRFDIALIECSNLRTKKSV